MRILLPICSLFVFDSLLRFVLLCLRVLNTGKNNFASEQSIIGCIVLIAAHDESGTIGPTVEALKTHLEEWPDSTLCVVADRCTDATFAEAAAAGAEVFVRTDEQLGKGAVVAWWLRHHEPIWRTKSAIVILDADTRIADGALSALKQAMVNGADAVQALVAPDATTSSGRLAGWSEVLMQRIDDEARRRCGWSVPLRGTGMAFRCELLAELAPSLHTYAEDLELDVILAARRAKVAFAPEATIFDPKPQQADGASRQRARWLQGQLQVLRDYKSEFVQALLTGGAGAWFLLWLLMLRPKILFIGLRILLLATGLLIQYQPLIWMALAGLAMDVAYYLAGATLVDNPRRYLLDLLSVPRFALMWFYSFGTALIRRRVWLKAGR